jgi:hypothetical protein
MPTPKIGDVHRTSGQRPIRASHKLNCYRNRRWRLVFQFSARSGPSHEAKATKRLQSTI